MRSGFGWRALALAAVLAGGRAAPARPADTAAQGPERPADALDAGRRELGAAAEAAAAAETSRRAAEADVESIRVDRLRLAAALIDTTGRVREAEAKTGAIEKRLDLLTGSEDAIKASLRARRGAIAEVLAALQRMGLHPLPAILASPDDVLRAIRTSMLLGAVVPEMRSAAEALAADLGELGRLRASIAGDRDALAAQSASLTAERSRLSTLVAARQAAQAAAEGTLDGARERATALTHQASGLKDLVARLEATRAADDARRQAAAADAAGVEAKAAAAARNPARLAPARLFADGKGQLSLPVAGKPVKGFGDADSYGGQERGLSLAARPGAVVTAPADGWVSFSGPYRSYGQLLILDAGNGYYLVLAGLARVEVVPGQFVLAGEPVGSMGDGSTKTAASIALGAGEPVLYVEFRHDGAAIDPSPWWAKAELEKVRG